MFDTVLWKLIICLSYLSAYHTSITYFLWGPLQWCGGSVGNSESIILV